MRASPADCKSALRLGGALCFPKSTWLHGGGYCGYCKSCFFGRRPCGRLLPTASRRSTWAAIRAYFALYLPFPLAARRVQLGAPSFPLAARRVQLGAPISPWLPAEYNSALPFPLGCPPSTTRRSHFPLAARRVQLGAPSPADCKSALRLGGALCLFCPLPALPLGCPPSTTRRSQPCRLQVGAPPGRRSVLILPFTCPSPWLPAEYNSALPVSPWLPFPSPLLPFPYPARRVQLGAPPGVRGGWRCRR